MSGQPDSDPRSPNYLDYWPGSAGADFRGIGGHLLTSFPPIGELRWSFGGVINPIGPPEDSPGPPWWERIRRIFGV